ncbi:MAG: choice-of-anchor B family protein [Bacteroidia bacterium]|nr:choice-of-anchor B family protein [Bacteroidia bacterium]
MKFKLVLTAFLTLILNVSAQNIQFRANLPYSPSELANIGGYTDPLGNEYALVGTDFGLSIVDVTDPDNPVIKVTVNGPNSAWREVKTYRNVAYVTTEGGGGLQIVDMTNLPSSVNTTYYMGDGPINGQLSSIHALHCDTAKGFLYLYGSNIGDGNTLFLNLSDPINPTYAGEYVYGGSQNDNYVHDGYVENDTMYESHIYSGFFTVVDVTNKSNPILLATQQTPTNFTHNTWISNDHKTLFTTDENSGSFLGVYDISDLGNIKESARFQTAPGSGAIIHNTHILNDYAITSWYKEGVVITDVARPQNPIEVGHYDTYAQGSGDGFAGCWGVYPFLPSGTIVASDINNGLYVLTPTYIRGCYLEGIITDSVSNAVLNGALIEVLSTTLTKNSNALGEYKTGTSVAGTYDVRISKAGYYSKTITGVVLTNGVLTTLDVALSPFQTFAFTGSVTDSLTGLNVPNALVSISSVNGLKYSVTTDVSGAFNFPAVVPDDYTVYAGKWGYRTSCSAQTLVVGNPIVATIAPGYYDDFTFDNGWNVTGTSGNSWERGEPIGTYDGSSTEINPDFDVNSDCSDTCFITDNGGAPYNGSDVDNGNTILTSPVFDGTIYQAPTLNYFRRYLCINGTGSPNDTMRISVSNGSTTVRVETVGPNDGTNGNWVQHSVLLSSLLAVTNTMTFSVEVEDNSPGNIVEGALDKFEITGLLVNSVSEKTMISSINAYPNPFNNSTSVDYKLSSYNGSIKLIVRDILGNIVSEKNGIPSKGSIRIGAELSAGIYMVELSNGSDRFVHKIVKQ